MTQTVAGTFATGADAVGLGDQQSGVLVCGSTVSGQATLNTSALDTNNKIRMQKSVDNGATWTTVANLTTTQVNATISVLPGEQYRLITIALLPYAQVNYKATLES